MMRLSEAILLGSTVVHPRAGSLRVSRTNEGCVLGMAAIAVGCTFTKALPQIPVKDLRTVNIEFVFGPWMLWVVMRPCECQWPLPREMRIKDVIAHLFDVHVMEKKNWSLQQLAEWVEGWEPRESTASTPIDEPIIRTLQSSQAAESRDEDADWQATRAAFEARHKSKRKRH
jgi:hypothetical protein